MKRILLLSLLIILANIEVKADQLAVLTQSQAKQVEDLFKNNGIRQVILFCGCCENETPQKVNVERFYTKIFDASSNQYEFVIEGRTEGGKSIKESVDLAYTFLKTGTKAECLGKILSFECDPCTLPFDWNTVTLKSGTIEISGNGTNGRLLVFVPQNGVYISKTGSASVKVWINRNGNITRHSILSATNEEVKEVINSKINEFRFNKLPSAPVEQNGVLSLIIKTNN